MKTVSLSKTAPIPINVKTESPHSSTFSLF